MDWNLVQMFEPEQYFEQISKGFWNDLNFLHQIWKEKNLGFEDFFGFFQIFLEFLKKNGFI